MCCSTHCRVLYALRSGSLGPSARTSDVCSLSRKRTFISTLSTLPSLALSLASVFLEGTATLTTLMCCLQAFQKSSGLRRMQGVRLCMKASKGRYFSSPMDFCNSRICTPKCCCSSVSVSMQRCTISVSTLHCVLRFSGLFSLLMSLNTSATPPASTNCVTYFWPLSSASSTISTPTWQSLVRGCASRHIFIMRSSSPNSSTRRESGSSMTWLCSAAVMLELVSGDARVSTGRSSESALLSLSSPVSSLLSPLSAVFAAASPASSPAGPTSPGRYSTWCSRTMTADTHLGHCRWGWASTLDRQVVMSETMCRLCSLDSCCPSTSCLRMDSFCSSCVRKYSSPYSLQEASLEENLSASTSTASMMLL
mmetsp:Transcript_15553/g.34358  ORF Transcript_15553/g.34358 Transcript_15553/m.34358 type:complete len:366 (+) Transcript_15553:3383-4480(+)